MRPIDADQLRKCYEGHNGLDDKASYESIRKMIDSQPTIYDFNKILEGFDKMIIKIKNTEYSVDEFVNANVQTILINTVSGLKEFLKEGVQNDEIN